MASSYTVLGTEKMTTGENAGNWGTKTNTNLVILEQAFGGYLAFTIDATSETLAITDGDSTASTSQARHQVIKLSGTLSGNTTVTVPNDIVKTYIVSNATSGTYTVAFKTVSGTGFTFSTTNKGVKFLYADGTNIVDTGIGSHQIDNTITVGVDDAGHDVKFFGDTASAYMLWDTSADDLVLAGAAGIDLAGDIDVDGTANLDAVDIDGAVQIDGATTVGVDGTGLDVKFFGDTSGSFLLWDQSDDALELTDSSPIKIGDGGDMQIYHDSSNSYITNSQGALKVATETSGIAITLGHSTSEVTVADNLTVTGTLTGTLATAAQGSVTSLGTLTTLTVDNIIVNGTTIGHTSDTDLLTLASGALTALGTVTVGVDNTGHDVQLFGASAGAYALWDESADLLDIRGATAAGAGLLKLTTGELTVVDADKLGRIDFQAPLESSGTDAILVAASIWAEADDTFAAGVNNTDIVFATGKSEAAAEKFRFTADNEIGVAGANYGTDGQVLTSGGAGAAVAWEDAASSAADDISAGDAAVSLATSSGDVTVDSNAGAVSIDGHTGVTLASSNSGDITLDSVADIVVDAAGGNVEFKDAGTLQLTLDMDGTSGVQIIKLGVNADDLVFQQYDGNEVMRINDDRKLYFYDDGGENISSDGTDFTFASGNDINLTATTDINVPSDVGITFGNDAEKIEGDGTDLTIAGNNINLTAVADVVIPANVGITFGSGEKIEGDSTDLTITSGAKINLTATSDVVIPANVGITFGTGEKIEGDSTDLTVTSGGAINLTATTDVVIPNSVGIQFGGASEKIEGDGTDLTISANNLTVDAAADIILDAAGNNVIFKSGGTSILDISNSSSDAVITSSVQDKDIIFKGDDGGSAITSLTLDMSAGGIATFSAAANVAQGALTSSSNAVAWDASDKPNAYHLTTENTTIGQPSNAVEGAFICIEINFNGSHTVAWNAIFNFAADTAPTTTDTDAKTDILVFRYNGAIWQEVGRTLNIPES